MYTTGTTSVFDIFIRPYQFVPRLDIALFFFNETELQDNCSIKILAMVRSNLKNDFGFCFSIKSVFRVSRSERKKKHKMQWQYFKLL